MLKKVVLAAAARCRAPIAGATITAPVTAQAMTCEDAAKMKYPDSMVDRMKYKRECKKAFKASMARRSACQDGMKIELMPVRFDRCRIVRKGPM